LARRKISFLRRVGYILEYAVVVPLAFFVSLIPWAWVPFVSRFLGKVLFHLDQRDREIATRNLDIIYKDKPMDQDAKNILIRKVFRNVARLALELLKIGTVTDKNYTRFVKMEGYENVDKALALGKGLIVVTAHLGNWEYLGGVPAKLGKDVVAIINRQHNPYTDIWIRNIRQKKGKLRCLYNEIGDLTKILRHLKKGGIVAIVADQTYYFKPIFVPFFGQTAATADGPARFHLKFGAPILMAFGTYQDDGKYLLKYEEAVSFEKTGDDEKDCRTIMTWINQQYEKAVLKNPDQWFSLMHDRWERQKPEDFNNEEDYPQ
jgi:Kdo2-lipid IVA lauroyltransferase/acyltransferase